MTGRGYAQGISPPVYEHGHIMNNQLKRRLSERFPAELMGRLEKTALLLRPAEQATVHCFGQDVTLDRFQDVTPSLESIR